MSLETLARFSGVSRAMLGQIETGKSVPTIKLIWKVAKALGVPTATLITSLVELPAAVVARSEIATITSAGGGFVLRPFEAANFRQPFEFSEMLVSPGHREDRAGGLLGSRATLLVASGSIDVQVGQDERHRLHEGDSILFRADVPPSYPILARLRPGDTWSSVPRDIPAGKKDRILFSFRNELLGTRPRRAGLIHSVQAHHRQRRQERRANPVATPKPRKSKS